MVLPRLPLANALVLQAGQRGQHVNGRGDVLAVQLPAEDDLPLGDIAGQVGDGVGLVVLRHGQNGDEGDRTRLALLPPRPLVQGGQVRVHIAGIAPAAGHFLPGGGDLPQSVGVVGDVRQYHQHVHILLKGQVLRSGQGHAGRGDALHRRVVGQVRKHDRPVDGAGAAELLYEEVGLLEGDADGGKGHEAMAEHVAQSLVEKIAKIVLSHGCALPHNRLRCR